MKEYFISEIDIEKLYHLSDIKIKLDSNKTPAFTFDWGRMVQEKHHCCWR